MSRLRPLLALLSATKLYWGLAALLAVGAWLSPQDSQGASIFLSYANLTDVLRQISITGIVAVGMTLVILTGGIDLSVGSIMALGSTVAAMLLTSHDWTNATLLSAPAVLAASTLVLGGLGRAAGFGRKSPAGALLVKALALGAGGLLMFLFVRAAGHGAGLAAALLAVVCVGFVLGGASGMIVSYGRLQPFIATLALMVTSLGLARVVAGPDQSVYPIYPGVNASNAVSLLRASVLGLPIPGLIFLAILAVFALILGLFALGRQVYAVGGNEKAAHLAGIPVERVKLVVYALSGALAGLAGLLYAVEYRQGKPDAGTGLELDAIAAVVIGGASLKGGKGSLVGTLIGVLIFGLLTNLFQLCNVDSSVQLVLKGVIIVLAVLLQEGRLESLRLFQGRRS